jgi:DNA-binding CsgD family transcriptional regulator
MTTEAAMAASLTERELETLRWMAKGLSAPTIAVYMGVAPATVRKRRQNLAYKLATHNQIETVRRGYELGLVDARR